MALRKDIVFLAILALFMLTLITFSSVTRLIGNYDTRRDLRYSFAVLRDPSIRTTGETYIGTPLVDFVLPDLLGVPHRLSDINAEIKIVVLFNTKDCAGCLEEYRLWKRLDAAYADEEVTIIGVANDREISDVMTFARERDLRFLILSDPDNVIRRSMGLRHSPLRITLDRKNAIAEISVTGMNLSQQKTYMTFLNSILKK